MSIVIETTLGDITVDLFLKERPKSCLNFIKLCKLKYYNFNLFHTIEQGFIAQTGDPTGAGDGGSSVWGVIEGNAKRFFEAETIPKIKHSEPGLLSMVGGENNMIGSQFFFTLGPDLASLDGTHCVIGEVTEGHEVLRKINEAICDENHRPYKDIRITHTVILEDPFSDPRGFRQPSRSPSPSAQRLKNGRIAADEEIDDTEGKTEAEIQEMLAEREAKARATILEIVGDIPDAEIAPPENVLFVCKLNPVTTDDDLKIIFSRFGKIKTCEVIRDKQSGDSLQYAFIEFEDRKSCEDAYFKMDNVLIDDRRIHVDFSQSVSKIKWRGKGNYEILEDSGEYKSKKLFRGSNSPSPEPGSSKRSRSRSSHRSRNRDSSLRGRYDDSRNRYDNSGNRYDNAGSRYDRGNWRNDYEKYNQWKNNRFNNRRRFNFNRNRRPASRDRRWRDRDSRSRSGSRSRRDNRIQYRNRRSPPRFFRDNRDRRVQEARRSGSRSRKYQTDTYRRSSELQKTKYRSTSRSRSRSDSSVADSKPPKKQRKPSPSPSSSSSSSTSESESSSDSDAKKKKKDKKKKSKNKKKKSKKHKNSSSDDSADEKRKKKKKSKK